VLFCGNEKIETICRLGSEMGQTARAFAIPVIDRQSLNRLENHFIAPEIFRRDDVVDRQARLARIVSSNIIPRLMRLHTEVISNAPPVEDLVESLAPSSADISGLADIVIGSDLEAAATYVTVLRDRGLSMEALFVELLEPTACYLGEMWDQDECDFVDVALGVARLQKLLAIFNDTHSVPSLDIRRHVLLATTPGDKHHFGVAMIEQLLVAAGWRVRTELTGTLDDIVNATRGNWFAVAGLTAGSDRQLDTLSSTIAEIRKHSRNRDIGIMVGGPIFTANPALVNDVGADATAPNAPAAVLTTQKLFDVIALKETRSAISLV
jgi:MerR family transcriptional regulator, light-induced transcriptional regulator